jgi:methylmalonyl-CoA mutase C-terminal domain/subunit
MTNRRVVLGALGSGEALQGVGRRLRDAGHEVVFVGGQQSAEQLVRTAVAEDAHQIVVPADDVPAVEAMLVDLHVDGVVVGCDEPDAPERPMNG